MTGNTKYIKQSLAEIAKHKNPDGFFKRLKNGSYPTMSLFLEPSSMLVDSTVEPIFTMKEHDHPYKGRNFPVKTYISLKKLYLAIADPTEYLFAKQVFGNYAHWKSMFKPIEPRESERTRDELGRFSTPWGWFKDLNDWRIELELQIRAEGLQSIINKSDNSSNAKWLVDKGWMPVSAAEGLGQRSKKLTRKELNQRTDIFNRVSTDKSKVLELKGKSK